MSLRDLGGVFSRYFLAGFFLPAFFGLVVASLLVVPRLAPRAQDDPSILGRLTVLAGLALLVGLVLLGLKRPIVRLLEGYPLEDWASRYDGRVSRRRLRPSYYAYELNSRMTDRQETLYERLHAKTDSDRDRDEETRMLDRYFAPRDLEIEVLPTRFGNALRAFEYYSESRWGLNGLAAWPRIAALLSDRERDLHADAETDLMFFVNISVTCCLLSAMLAVDGVVSGSVAGLTSLPA